MSKTIACDVQYAPHAWDYYEEKGMLDESGAISLFRDFPFDEKLAIADTLEEGTVPTISIKDTDESVFAFWLRDPGVFQIHMEFGKEVALTETSDKERIESMIRRYYGQDRAGLFAEIQREQPADPKSPMSPGVIWILFFLGLVLLLFWIVTCYVPAA